MSQNNLIKPTLDAILTGIWTCVGGLSITVGGYRALEEQGTLAQMALVLPTAYTTLRISMLAAKAVKNYYRKEQ